MIRLFVEKFGLNENAQLDSIQEAYFGQTPEMIKIRDIIGVMRTKYNGAYALVNSSKEMIELSRAVEEAFGFSIFCLTITGDMDHNAFTLPVSETIGVKDPSKFIIATKQGIKYNTAANYSTIVFITQGMFFNTLYSDDDIMAILLHEIGHNFFAAGDTIGRGFSYISRVTNLMALPAEFIMATIDPQIHGTTALSLIPGVKRKFLQWVENQRKTDPDGCKSFDEYIKAVKSVLGVIGAVIDGASIGLAVVNPITTIAKDILTKTMAFISQNPLNFVKLITGTEFRSEAAADSFATMYGYGPNLVSALKTMKHRHGGMLHRVMFGNTPFLGNYIDLLSMPTKILFGFMDEHPELGFRALDQITYLEKEIEKTQVSKEMKVEMKKQIADIKKNIKVIADVNKKGFKFTNLYTRFLITMTGGDFRGFYARDIDKMYDKMIEDANKRSK